MTISKITNIEIIEDEDYFRLKYKVGEFRVASAGFKNKKEFCKVIMEDTMFVIGEK